MTLSVQMTLCWWCCLCRWHCADDDVCASDGVCAYCRWQCLCRQQCLFRWGTVGPKAYPSRNNHQHRFYFYPMNGKFGALAPTISDTFDTALYQMSICLMYSKDTRRHRQNFFNYFYIRTHSAWWCQCILHMTVSVQMRMSVHKTVSADDNVCA